MNIISYKADGKVDILDLCSEPELHELKAPF